MPKIHMRGWPDIKRSAVYDAVFDHYLEIEGMEHYIGPPSDAVNTIEFETTGRWRWAGDAVNPWMEIEFLGKWTMTSRKIKWSLRWPFMHVVELPKEECEHVFWFKDDDIIFMVEENMHDCRCKDES